MNEAVGPSTEIDRKVVEGFEKAFERLHARSRMLIETTPLERLYTGSATGSNGASPSVGSYVLRSAAVVEQTFGGITANLWDDPFEWTLPETLSTGARIIEYLDEVEETRKRAFACFSGDEDLKKEIAAPSGDMCPLINLLLDTLVRAAELQGRALAQLATLSNPRPNGFII
ncbi:MAG: hypothetical protein ACREBG_06010 [Pyrinomonadaceae bacterium]